MNPEEFRRDAWLRSSGYHLATWSLFALVLEIGRAAPARSGAASTVVLVAAAVLTSLTHERRIGKMAGPALAPVWDGAGRLWWSLFGAFLTVATLLLAGGRAAWLVPLALATVGVGYLVWSRFVGRTWLAAIGVAAVLAATIDAATTAAGEPPFLLRALVLGIVLPAAGLWTSRRYLWFR